MTIPITQTEPNHPPLRRTTEAKLGDYTVRATASAHWRPEANEYAPFRVDGTITVTNSLRHVVLTCTSTQLHEILRAVNDVTVALEAKEITP